MDRIGAGHIVLCVDIYLPKASTRQTRFNQALAEVIAERPAEIFIYSWSTSSKSKWLSGDSVHYTGTGPPTPRPGPRALIDEATLTEVADLTGGEYYRAQDAEQLSTPCSTCRTRSCDKTGR